MPRYRIHFEYGVSGVAEVEADNEELAHAHVDFHDPVVEVVGDVEVTSIEEMKPRD